MPGYITSSIAYKRNIERLTYDDTCQGEQLRVLHTNETLSDLHMMTHARVNSENDIMPSLLRSVIENTWRRRRRRRWWVHTGGVGGWWLVVVGAYRWGWLFWRCAHTASHPFPPLPFCCTGGAWTLCLSSPRNLWTRWSRFHPVERGKQQWPNMNDDDNDNNDHTKPETAVHININDEICKLGDRDISLSKEKKNKSNTKMNTITIKITTESEIKKP